MIAKEFFKSSKFLIILLKIYPILGNNSPKDLKMGTPHINEPFERTSENVESINYIFDFEFLVEPKDSQFLPINVMTSQKFFFYEPLQFFETKDYIRVKSRSNLGFYASLVRKISSQKIDTIELDFNFLKFEKCSNKVESYLWHIKKQSDPFFLAMLACYVQTTPTSYKVKKRVIFLSDESFYLMNITSSIQFKEKIKFYKFNEKRFCLCDHLHSMQFQTVEKTTINFSILLVIFIFAIFHYIFTEVYWFIIQPFN